MKKLALVVMIFAFSVGANAACNTASLKGSYGLGAVSSGANASCASIGQVLFNGNGVVNVVFAQGCGGNAQTSTGSGNYEI